MVLGSGRGSLRTDGDLTSLGDTLHQAGRTADAEAQFVKADGIRDKEGQPIPNLFFFWGFGYCELLLTLGMTDKAIERARRALEQIDQTRGSKLAVAQMHLALGRALLVKLQDRAADLGFVKEHLDQAMQGLSEANHQVHMPPGRLARADLRRLSGDFEGAKADLDEVLAIATRDPQAPMLLYQVDYFLGQSRLHLTLGFREDARHDLNEARRILQETRYHRRDSELADLESKLL